MTADRAWLDEVQAQADAATPGPWTVDGKIVWGTDLRGRRLAAQTQRTNPEDLAFIAAARTDVPRLLALVRAQGAALDAVRELVRESAAATRASMPMVAAARLIAHGGGVPVQPGPLRAALALADPEKEK